MEEHAITHLGTPGNMIPLDEFPCANCGAPGVTHIALAEQGGTWAFCSWDHLLESMRVDDQPLTEETMKAAGLHIIGPRPEA